jgi:putative multiple sugar transport system ATP-binding protein
LLDLKAHGIACILISHKLSEVAQVADRITVIRDGATVKSFDCRVDAASEDEVIRAMVGRPMADRYPKRTPQIGDTVFEVRDWQVHHPEHADRLVVKGVSLHVRRGEIVGIAGLMGAGRTELAMSVFGRAYGRGISGEVRLHGRAVDVGTIGKAIAAGPRLRHRGSQALRPGARGRRPPQHHPRPTCAASRARRWSTAVASTVSRTTTGSGCASAARASSRTS